MRSLRYETGKRLEPCVKTILFFSYRFVTYLKQCCTQNLETLLRTPVDDKDESRNIASSREGVVSVDRCTEDWLVPLSCRNQIRQS